MKKDVFIYFICKCIVGLIGIIILNLYSSMINPTNYGEYSLISSLVVALVSIFIGWIGSSALRYYDEYSDKKVLFFTNIFIYFILMLLICFICLIICSLFMPSIPISNYFVYVFFFLITIGAQEVLEKILRASNKTFIYAFSSVIQSILSILIFYLFAKYYNFQAEAIFLSSILSKFIFIIICMISIGFVIKFNNFVFDKDLLKKFLKYGIPMIGVWGVSWILHYCDRYIISLFIDNFQVGIYDMSCKISENTINLLISSFTLSIFPLLIKDWNKGGVDVVKSKMASVIKFYNLLVLPAVFGLIAISDQLYLYIIDKSYSSGLAVIIIITVGTYINGLTAIYNKIWQLNEKTKKILYILIFSVLLNIILNIILIPKYGINAAASTTLISYVFSFVITYIYSKKDMPIKFEIGSFIKTLLACLFMFLFVILYKNVVYSFVGLLIEILLAAVIYLIINIILKNINISGIVEFLKKVKKNV